MNYERGKEEGVDLCMNEFFDYACALALFQKQETQ